MHERCYLEIAGLIAEGLGTWFLFKEVLIAHKSERLQLDHERTVLAEAEEAAAEESEIRKAHSASLAPLSNWLENPSGMAPDEAMIYARRLLGLDRNQRVLDLKKWFDTQWTNPRRLATRIRNLFMGVALLLLAVLIHAIIFLSQRETTELPGPPVATEIRSMGPHVVFDPGQGLLRYNFRGKAVDLTAAACSVKEALISVGAEEALVIGHHDQTRLGTEARETFSSNQGLAQRRADEVGHYIAEDNSCGPGIRAIPFMAGPRATGKQATKEALANDRMVEVWGLLRKLFRYWRMSSGSL